MPSRRSFLQQLVAITTAIAMKPETLLAAGDSQVALADTAWMSEGTPLRSLLFNFRYAAVEQPIGALRNLPMKAEDYKALLDSDGIGAFTDCLKRTHDMVGIQDSNARSVVIDDIAQALKRVSKAEWNRFVDSPQFFSYVEDDFGGIGQDWYDVSSKLKDNLQSRSFWRNLYDAYQDGLSPEIEQEMQLTDKMRRAAFRQDVAHAREALEAHRPADGERALKDKAESLLDRMQHIDEEITFSELTAKIPKDGYRGYNITVARQVVGPQGRYESAGRWQQRSQSYAAQLTGTHSFEDENGRPACLVDTSQCARGRLVVRTTPGSELDLTLRGKLEALRKSASCRRG